MSGRLVEENPENFSMPVTQVPREVLYEAAYQNDFNPKMLPSQAEIDYGEIEPALESMDGRTDHERAVDATLQYFVDRYDGREYDLILTSVDYDLTEPLGINSEGPSKSMLTRRYQGEFDVFLLDIDAGVAESLEVKPHKGQVIGPDGEPIHEEITHELRAERQAERKRFAFEVLNDNLEGFKWDFYPVEPVYESQLRPEHEIPDSFSGSYYWDDEARSKALEDENFRKLKETMLDTENPDLFEPETALTRERRERGDFVAEFLND